MYLVPDETEVVSVEKETTSKAEISLIVDENFKRILFLEKRDKWGNPLFIIAIILGLIALCLGFLPK